ncbi:MAG: pilus assembly protein [Rhodospirillales bacterium]|nr:pilus assembly protein [Rhodospirillales bacterium]
MLRRFVSWRAPGARPGPGEEGVAALEFAIVAPLFLALVFGIIVYGIYFTIWIAVTEAASEGARASVAGLDTAERVSLATAEVTNFFNAYGPMLSLSHATVVAEQVPGNAGAFEVAVTYNLSSLGLGTLAGLLPIPTATPTATVIVSNGG